MKDKKVGIITHYYMSNNYGGNLQAYALASYINKINGFVAEQICYSFLPSFIHTEENPPAKKNRIKLLFSHPFVFCKKILQLAKRTVLVSNLNNKYKSLLTKKLKKQFEIRRSAICYFNQSVVPHSNKVYYKDTLYECSENYDIFITGSDQVWSACDDGFILKFVDNKPKISYAAAIARKTISDEHKQFLFDNLKDYKAISVRDETDKQIISKLTDYKVKIVLDPVFLLSRDEWEMISSDARRYKKPYVFCYFLGDNKKTKNLVKLFAKKRGLKTVIIPHFKDNLNETVLNDLYYGNYKPFDVSPADFIALIRDAEYVFSDSFHAVVFSIIYHKNFFAFDRVSMYGNMSSRMINLLKKFNLIDRFCCQSEKESVDYLNRLCDINFQICDDILKRERSKAESFLLNNLT